MGLAHVAWGAAQHPCSHDLLCSVYSTRTVELQALRTKLVCAGHQAFLVSASGLFSALSAEIRSTNHSTFQITYPQKIK